MEGSLQHLTSPRLNHHGVGVPLLVVNAKPRPKCLLRWGFSSGIGWVEPTPPSTYLARVGAPRADAGAEHVLGDAFGVEFGALFVGYGVDHAALENVGEVPWGQRDTVRGHDAPLDPGVGAQGRTERVGHFLF